MPCTWMGFEFDYRNADPLTKLQCTTTSSAPSNYGNPGEVSRMDATTNDYEMELEGQSGHFFNPQYWIFNVRSSGKSTIVTRTSCQVDGKTVFDFLFNIHFPVAPR